MAVLKTSTYLITLPAHKLRQALASLQTLSVGFEILDPHELGGQWNTVVKTPLSFDATIEEKKDLVGQILSTYESKGLFSFLFDQRIQVNYEDMSIDEDHEQELLAVANRLQRYREIQDLYKVLGEIQRDHQDKHVWVGSSTSKIAVDFEKYAREIIVEFNKNHQEAAVEMISPEVYVLNYNNLEAIAVLPEVAEYLQEFLDSAEPGYQSQLTSILKFNQNLKNELTELEAEFVKWKINPKKISHDWLKKLAILHAKYEMSIKNISLSQNIFQVTPNDPIFFAFVSVSEQTGNLLRELLDSHALAYQEVDWSKEIVIWQNPSSLKSFQNIAQALGTIDSREADPTFLMSIFYVFFFAMALNDALYGLLIAVVCGYLLYFTNLKENFKGMVNLFFLGGALSIVIGALSNSWAGNLFARTPVNEFLSYFQIISPLQAEDPVPVNQILLTNGGISPIVILLAFSIFLGLLHIFSAYYLKVKTALINGDKVGAVSELNWMAFLIVLGVSLFALATNQVWTNLSLISLSLLIFGLFVINQGRGLFGKFLSGLLKLYEIIAFFADMLSYTRLIAVGLTGAIIAEVINLLGFLIYGSVHPILGFFLAAIILIIGHSFNMLVCGFGAYINPLRLHYVEFMPKFFQGNGRSLKPFDRELTYLKLRT